MILSHVVATSKNNVIGSNNKIPWDLPEDRKYFRNLTLNHPIILGRKTYESIGKPLPKRPNIVISRTLKQIEGCKVCSSLKEAIDYCSQQYPTENEIFIVGGAEIYKESMPLISKIYLTLINQNFEGDTLYPEIPSEFQEISRIEKFDSGLYYSFLVFKNENFTINF